MTDHKGRIRSTFLLVLVLGGLIVFGLLNNSRVPQREQKNATVLSIFSHFMNPPVDDPLIRNIKDILAETDGTYGIFIKHLGTNKTYTINEHQEFKSASLYKLWVMAVAFNQKQNNRLMNNITVNPDLTKIHEAFYSATEEAMFTKGNSTQSVDELLEKMITISDNDSAHLLSSHIRLSKVTTFLQENGLRNSTIGDHDGYPKTSPYDIGLFFEKLYNSELADKVHTYQMLELLKKQLLNGKLPKDLPADVVIAHKTGELERVSHDAGIVYSNKGNYIIVIMSETDDHSVANDQIARISKVVYDYFINN
ncbi:MAG: class A beta-lactamase-related serine hydrolase [bacterium]|nr:class A beta-lactamase-related serine hydrolase [bacterium]